MDNHARAVKLGTRHHIAETIPRGFSQANSKKSTF